MILIDTSVWVNHFRQADTAVGRIILEGALRQHPLVTAELAMGNLAGWRRTITLLDSLPQVAVASHQDLIGFVDRHGLAGSGIGVIDAHLLASADANALKIWTLDRRLLDQATRLGLDYRE